MGSKPTFSRAENPWTADEENILKGCFERHMTDKETQVLLPDRSVQAISIHRRDMGLVKLFKLTGEEKAYLKEQFLAHVPVEDIAKVLNRSYGVLKQCIHNMGLKRDVSRTKLVQRYGLGVLDLADMPEKIRAVIKARTDAEKEVKKAEQAQAVNHALDYMVTAIEAGTAKRDAIQQARLAGVTLQQIGTRLGGITRERVRQISFGLTAKHRSSKPQIPRERTVVCRKCSDSFTVTTKGNYFYCKKCKPIVDAVAHEERRKRAKIYAQNHRAEARVYQAERLKLGREATLVAKLTDFKKEDPSRFAEILAMFKEG